MDGAGLAHTALYRWRVPEFLQKLADLIIIITSRFHTLLAVFSAYVQKPINYVSNGFYLCPRLNEIVKPNCSDLSNFYHKSLATDEPNYLNFSIFLGTCDTFITG